MQQATVKPLRTTKVGMGQVPSESPAAGHLPPENGYRIGQRLDRGGPDEVYEASHPAQPGKLAIKLMRRALAAGPRATEAFRREAARVSGLRHPNVVQVIEMGSLTQGVPYLVMEFLAGQSLRTHLARRGPMSAMESVPWIKALSAALGAAHSAGVIHGGLRPSKVFLAEAVGYDRGFVKLLDFCSWHLGASPSRGPDGEMVAYTAPEMQSVNPEATQVAAGSADQFSLAAIAYRLLSGRDAFVGGTVGNVLSRVMNETPRALSDLTPCDPMVEQVVMKGLAKRPSERWESVLAFANAFEQAALSSLPVVTQTVSRSQVLASQSLQKAQAQARAAVPLTSQAAAHAPTVPVAVSAAVPGAVAEQENEDELSQQFFAEGQRQDEAFASGRGGSAIYGAGARSVAQPARRSTQRSYDHLPSLGSVEPYESVSRLMRLPRRRWPGRLLALAVLTAGAVGYWRSSLPYSAEVRAWVTQNIPSL